MAEYESYRHMVIFLAARQIQIPHETRVDKMAMKIKFRTS